MELYIPPKRINKNPINGRFVKGSIPHNKGKKWEDYIDKDRIVELRKKASESIRKNGVQHPFKARPVICIDKDGNHQYYESMTSAAKAIGTTMEYLWKGCHGVVKTVKGYRVFLFESDEWTKLIK